MEISDDWKPTPENINALPKGLFDYVCGLETLCDPAGIVAENMLLKDEIAMFQVAFKNLKRRKNVSTNKL